MHTTAFAIALRELPGIADKSIGNILQGLARAGLRPEQAMNLDVKDLIASLGVSESVAKAMRHVNSTLLTAAENVFREAHRSEVEILTIVDAAYPTRFLQNLEQAPSVVYLYGNVALLNQHLAATANSNDSPETTLAASDSVLESLIDSGKVPITGHNRPAYQRAALVALRRGKGICYVLDRGLLAAFDGDLTRNLFPAANIWSSRFDPTENLAISVWPMTAHGKGNFNRRRDSIIFELADDVIVGDIRAGGEMENQCNKCQSRGASLHYVLI